MARNEVKIRFDAETKDFKDGITSMNSDLRKLSGELKLNATQLKGNAGDTELLQSRKKMLTTELEKARNKVELSNQMLEKAKAIYGEDSKVVENYTMKVLKAKDQEAAIQNELAKTTQELVNQKNTLNETSQKITEFGDGIENAGEKMSVVSVAIGAAGAASVKAAMDMDDGYDTIITKTGATGDALEGLTESMDNVFTSLPIEAETAGIAIGEVNTRFGETGKELEDLSSEFIKFAEINSTDLNASIDNVDSIMTKFNVDTSQTSSVLGLMTKAGQDTGISMDTLQNTLTSNGATLKEMGLDFSASVNLLAQFESSGVDASTAMAGLKKAQQNATEEGKSLQDALGETIESIKGAETETEALQIATELFGKKGAAEMTQAIREGRFSVEDLSTSLSDYEDTVSNTYENTLDPWDKSKVALNQLKAAGSDLAGSVLTELEPVIESATEKVEGFTQWFSSLSDEEQTQIAKIAGVVAAIGPALVVTGKVIQGVGTITKLLGTAKAAMAAHAAATAVSTAATTGETVAQTGLNTSLLACPITWVVLAIAGLIAAFVLAYNKSETFRNAVNSLGAGLKDAFGNVTDFFGSIKSTFEENGGGLKGVAAVCIEGVKTTFATGYDVLNTLTGGKLEELKGKAKEKLDGVKSIYEENGGGIKGVIAVGLEGQKAVYTAGYNAINTLTGGKLDELKSKAKEKLDGVKSIYQENGGGIKGVIAVGLEGQKAVYTAGYNAINTLTGGKLDELKSKTKEKLDGVKNIYEENGGGIKGVIAVGMTAQKEVFETGYNAINKLTGGKLDNVVSTVKSKIESLKSKFTDGVEKIKEIFNFKLKAPDIKMPSITVTYDTSGKLAEAAKFLGLQGMPKFNIKWNAEGAILTRPTIFGFANGMLQGGGEAGPEAVLPIEKLEEYIGNQMAQFIETIPTIDYEKLGNEVAKAVEKIDTRVVFKEKELGRVVRSVLR